MKPSISFVIRTIIGITFLMFYCEVLIYYFVQLDCSWPTLDFKKRDSNITSDEEPVRIMVIADTHLLGSRKGHWFDKLRREWQMYRAFQTAISLHEPELVFVLGDLLDEGSFCSENEFNYYIERFYSLFSVPESTTMYVVVGNHDIGFHYRINPYLEQRFQNGFNSPPVQLVSLRGNHFILINSMALEGDGCFLCKPAEAELTKIEKMLKCSQNETKNCDYSMVLTKYSRPILLQCSWPTLDFKKRDSNITSDEEPVRIMVIADTHLLGSRKGHWFDKLRREWQMYRAFQTAISLHEPELVFVLGDLLDEGSFCSENEFNYYIERFYSLFSVPESTTMYVVVGNHDIGFHYRINPYLEQRFQNGFNSPPVQLVSLRGNHFILINSMALEGDGCFLCKPAEAELSKIEKMLKCSQNETKNCDYSMVLTKYSRPILLQHFPLYRDSDKDCTDFDAAPLPEREERFREKWECLSKESTYQLLKQLKPRLVLSGHTHHGCTRNLPVGDGIEITVPSFSWRNKDNPNYALGVITPNNYAISKCAMPKESSVINCYIVGIAGLFIWLFFYKGRNVTASRVR